MSHDVAPGCPIFANLVSKDAQDFEEVNHRKVHRKYAAVARQWKMFVQLK